MFDCSPREVFEAGLHIRHRDSIRFGHQLPQDPTHGGMGGAHSSTARMVHFPSNEKGHVIRHFNAVGLRDGIGIHGELEDPASGGVGFLS